MSKNQEFVLGTMVGVLVASVIRKTPRQTFTAQHQGLYALMQLKPRATLLATSFNRADLEFEMKELQATVNHYQLREERHQFAIVPVPKPLVARDPIVRITCQSK